LYESYNFGGEVRREIVLIGPVGVGKMTVCKLLAERLNISKVSMDDVLFGYFREVWFDENHWKLIAEKLGKPAAYRYLKVFGSYGVKRILEDNKDCVFEFGGGGVMGEFPDEFAAMKAALADFENVVVLIPTSDERESLQSLYVNRRRTVTPPRSWSKYLAQFLNLPFRWNPIGVPTFFLETGCGSRTRADAVGGHCSTPIYTLGAGAAVNTCFVTSMTTSG
jgi:shikimate kinase